MNDYNLQRLLLEELGYLGPPESTGFSDSPEWSTGRSIPYVDGAYDIQNVRMAYFSHLDDADPERIQMLYQSIWNESRAPILYVSLPQEIRVYNCYAEPVRTADELDHEDRLLRHLGGLVDVTTARNKIRRQLHKYDRLHIDTGAFWTTSDGQKIQQENRADRRLLNAMSQVRRHLIEAGLSNEMAYALLGRSILIRYLEDRQMLEFGWEALQMDTPTANYRVALDDEQTAYDFFEQLNRRFNGDLFPVEGDERRVVQQRHLNLIGEFLDGTDLDTGQQSFWPFDFRYIPIELVSGIYDTFLNSKDRRSTGTYYTPHSLVDFILSETLPPEDTNPDMTILDPACGSGVFLVRAYQRLVNAWKQQHQERPTAQHLSDILRNSIFGVDIHQPAVRIAAFSLYLAMLDHLDKTDVQDESFHFPRLEGTNLFADDFFSPKLQKQLEGRKFDRIIGNPPWGTSNLTQNAAQLAASHEYEIGYKSIAQVFLQHVPKFCNDDGEIALLAPTKSTILVNSPPHEGFRQQFFGKYEARVLINFSALRYELFPDTISPGVAILYKPKLPAPDSRITYCVPKPSALSQQMGAIVLDTTEVKYLDLSELIKCPELWKAGLWGSSRDAALIQHLKSLPTLEEQAKQLGWKIAEGIQIGGGDKNPAPWLENTGLLPTRSFQRYFLDADALEPIEEKEFHRPRTEEIIRAPLCLVLQGIDNKRCASVFSAMNLAYRHQITGITGQAGQEQLLKWLTAYINSPLVQYYQFLTSTSWAVERGRIIQREFKRMPFLVPNEDNPLLKNILMHFDQILDLLKQRNRQDKVLRDEQLNEAAIKKHEDEIADLIFEIYGLTQAERQLIRDMAEYGIGFFYWSKLKTRQIDGTAAVQSPSSEMLTTYAEIFVETVTSLLRYQDQTLNAVVYHDSAPLSVVGFELVPFTDKPDVQLIEGSETLLDVLRRLDKQLLEQRAPSVYMRRHVRIYNENWLYLVRPSEQRFWTQSQARVDADNAIAEWLSRPVPHETGR